MSKYHIDKSGKPAVCHAKRKPCPNGSSSEHFESISEANDYADQLNEQEVIGEIEINNFYEGTGGFKVSLEQLANSKSYKSRIEAINNGYTSDDLINDKSPKVRKHLAEIGLYTIELQNDKDVVIANLAKEKDLKASEEDKRMISRYENNLANKIDKQSSSYDKYRSAYAREKWRNSETTNEKMSLSDAYKLSLEEGGMSYDLESGELQRTGMFVSKFPENSKMIKFEDYTEESLNEYIAENKETLENTPRSVVGVWHDKVSGNVFLDVSQRTFDSAHARKISEEADQIAFFDTTNFDEVTVDRNATSGGVTAMAS